MLRTIMLIGLVLFPINASWSVLWMSTQPVTAPPLPPVAAPVEYKDLMLVVVGSEHVVAIDFFNPQHQSVKYRYRCWSRSGEKEETGTGDLIEKHERIHNDDQPKPAIRDKGSKRQIRIKSIGIMWSYGSPDAGWVYYNPEECVVAIAYYKKFETIDLSRFDQRKRR